MTQVRRAKEVYIRLADDIIFAIPDYVAKTSSVIQSSVEEYGAGTIDNPIPITPGFAISLETIDDIIQQMSQNTQLQILSDKQLSTDVEYETPDISMFNFYDLIGYDCGVGSLSYIARTLISRGDWTNFEDLFYMAQHRTGAECLTWKNISDFDLRTNVLNAIMHFTDYKDTIPERQNRCDLFHCLIENYFNKYQRFDDRLRLVETMRCNDLSACKGGWTDELLLIPYDFSNFEEQLAVKIGTNMFKNFDWSNICLHGDTVSAIISGRDKIEAIILCMYDIDRSDNRNKLVTRVFSHFAKFGYNSYEGDVDIITLEGKIPIILMLHMRVSRYHVAELPVYVMMFTHMNCVYDGAQVLMTYPCLDAFNRRVTKVNSEFDDGDREDGQKYLEDDFRIVAYDDRQKRILSTTSSKNIKSSNPLSFLVISMESPILGEIPESDLFTKHYNGNIHMGIVTKIEPQIIVTFSGEEVTITREGYMADTILSSSGNEMSFEHIKVGDIMEHFWRTYIDRSVYYMPGAEKSSRDPSLEY